MVVKDLEEKWKILSQRIIDFKNGEISSMKDDFLSFYLKKNVGKSIDFDQEKNEFVLGRYETGEMSHTVDCINEGRKLQVGFIPLERFSLYDMNQHYFKNWFIIEQEIKRMTNECYELEAECAEIKGKFDYSCADLYLTNLQRIVNLNRRIQRERLRNILLDLLG